MCVCVFQYVGFALVDGEGTMSVIQNGMETGSIIAMVLAPLAGVLLILAFVLQVMLSVSGLPNHFSQLSIRIILEPTLCEQLVSPNSHISDTLEPAKFFFID